MTNLSLFTSNHLISSSSCLSNRINLSLQPRNLLTLRKLHTDISSAASFSFHCCPPLVCRKTLLNLRCNKTIIAKIHRNSDEKNNHLGNRQKHNWRRRFSLRLRPRLRLLSYRLKQVSPRGLIREAGDFLGRNSRRVTLSAAVSTALGVCFLFLKFTAVPASKVVAYSDLVSSLQSGVVSTVLFEEGSRRIFYNTQEGLNLVEGGRTSSSSTPKWQFNTRKIDHDENFLLSLMREKGTSYSSAPQSALAAVNSPAKKRRPSNLRVSFEDVEGVDAAKEELVEAQWEEMKKPAGTAEEIEKYFGCSSSLLVMVGDCSSSLLVMVGDRNFTDVVYRNMNGFLTILTKPLNRAREPFIVRLGSGFDIDNVDLLEMEQCYGVVVPSAIFGNYDILQQPRNISEAAKRSVCFYMFVDEETEANIKNSTSLDSEKRVGLWRVVVVRNLPYEGAMGRDEEAGWNS